ncbi:MAG: phasin family protein [Pseudomonadota bacterium]
MSNPFGEFDLSKMMDFSKLLSDFKPPGIDMDKMISSQRRNLEALTQANQVAVEGMQAVAKRQAEIFRQVMEESSQMAKDMLAMGSPEDKAAKHTALTKDAFQRAVSNMRELAEMVAKSNTEAFDVINKRVADSLDELRETFAKRAQK